MVVKIPKAKARTPVRPPSRPKTPVKPAAPAPKAPKPELTTVKTTTGKIKVPVSLLADKGHPPLYETLSMLGLFLAAMRSHEEGAATMALRHVGGFMTDLQKYNIPFPAREFESLRHYCMAGEWAQAANALREFSNAFGAELRKAIDKDHSIRAEAYTLADTFLQMIAARSAKRWDQLEPTAINKFKYLDNPELAQVWRVKVEGGQTKAVDELHEIVQEAEGPGRQGAAAYTLSFEEKKALLKSNPELNDRYNKARNAAKDKFRKTLRNYILDHDDHPQPVPQTREAMEEQGIYLHDLRPELDSLYVRSDGHFSVDYEGEMLRIIQRPGDGTTIGKFNPDYNPTTKGSAWLFLYKTEEGKWSRAYSELTKRAFKEDKSDDIIPMLESVPKARPKWYADMEDDNEKISIPALMTDIIYWSCARIGSKNGFVKGYGTTYGLSTLLVKHCHREKGQVILEYPGKAFGKGDIEKSVMQKHVFRDSNPDEHRIAVYLRFLCKGKGPDDPIFTYENGKPCTATQVRNYLNTLGIPNLHPHSLRSIRGSLLMIKLMDKIPKKNLTSISRTEAWKLFESEAEEVGRLLGHAAGGKVTGSTAIANYIDPSWAQQWFAENHLAVPIQMKSMLSNRD